MHLETSLASTPLRTRRNNPTAERELFIDNLLVRIHVIIEMIWWTGLAPWEFEFQFPGSLTSTFLGLVRRGRGAELLEGRAELPEGEAVLRGG